MANGAAAVDCALLADIASVKLGSELHVAPCGNDTVIIVIAGRAADDLVEDEVVAGLTMLAGGQFEIDPLAPVAGFTADDACEGEAVAVEASEMDEIGIELGWEKVFAYQTELGTGTRVIVMTEVTDVDVVEVDQSVGRMMVQVEVKVAEVELEGLADQLGQVVVVGSADVPGPVARPLQVELVQVPKADQPVGVEDVVVVDVVVETPPAGVEPEVAVQP